MDGSIEGEQIGIDDMAGIFILLSCSMPLAMMALIVEFLAASYVDTVIEQKRGVSARRAQGWKSLLLRQETSFPARYYNPAWPSAEEYKIAVIKTRSNF